MSPPKLHGTGELEVALRNRVDGPEQPHIDGGATEHLFHVVRVDAALLLNLLGEAAAAKERLPVLLELLPDENVIAMARPANPFPHLRPPWQAIPAREAAQHPHRCSGQATTGFRKALCAHFCRRSHSATWDPLCRL